MYRVVSVVLNNFKNDNRVLKEAISLQKTGYDVKVAAIYEEGLTQNEMLQNIAVERVVLTSKDWSKHKIIQLVKYVEFIYKVVKRYKKFDIIHCNDLNALVCGVLIKRLYNKNVKVVYDAHEYEINVVPNESRYRVKLKYFIEKLLIRYADTVFCVSDSIANEYVKLYKIKKPALVLNAPPYQDIQKQNIFRETFGISEDKTIFLYQGGLGKGRGIEILLETFKDIGDDKSVIVFMGYGVLESKIKSYATQYSSIYYHEAVSSEVLLNYTSSADFGILFYENSCLNHEYCSPNKMFEYLMAEIPVIVSNLYEMKRLVSGNNIGVVALENTVKGLSDATKKALSLDKEELHKNILHVKKTYNWENQEKVLLKAYEELF